MRRWRSRLAVVMCFVLVLAVGLLLAIRSAPPCSSQGPGGPALTSQGPVTISVDHTIYAPTDTVVVTITNHMTTPILLVSPYSGSGSCPLYLLVNVTTFTWNPPCGTSEAGPVVLSIELEPNVSAVARFTSASYAGIHLDTPLTDGPYQVEARYLPSPFDLANVQYLYKRAIPIPSPTFRVCTCRTC